MNGIVFVVPGFNKTDLDGLPSFDIADGINTIYTDGTIHDLAAEYKVGVHNMPDVYYIDGPEWTTTCTCDDGPIIIGDTFVNITHKASSVLKQNKDRIDNYKDDLLENINSNRTKVCVTQTSAVYDLCRACWAFPDMVKNMKEYALGVIEEIIDKTGPIFSMIISYNGMTGFDQSGKNIRRYNGKIFNLSKVDGGLSLESGRPTNRGVLVADLPIDKDILKRRDVSSVIRAVTGVGDPVFGVSNMINYDAIMTKHLESFGYV